MFDPKKRQTNREQGNKPHVIQSRPSLPPLRPLHNIHTLHLRTKHLRPHLHSNPGQLIPQQKSTVHPAQPDAQTHAGERVAIAEGHAQDITRLHAARVAAVVEERLAFAFWIERAELTVGYGGDGVFADVSGARGWGVDFEGFADWFRSISIRVLVRELPKYWICWHTLIRPQASW